MIDYFNYLTVLQAAIVISGNLIVALYLTRDVSSRYFLVPSLNLQPF